MPIRFAGRGIFNSDKMLTHLSFIDDSYEWLNALWNTVTVKVGKRNTLASLMCVICRQQRLKTMHAIRQAEEQRFADAACGAESQAQQPMPLMQDRGQLQRSHYDDVLDGQHWSSAPPPYAFPPDVQPEAATEIRKRSSGKKQADGTPADLHGENGEEQLSASDKPMKGDFYPEPNEITKEKIISFIKENAPAAVIAVLLGVAVGAPVAVALAPAAAAVGVGIAAGVANSCCCCWPQSSDEKALCSCGRVVQK